MSGRIALVYLGAGTFFGQPMGLLFLQAWLRAHTPDWEVRIIDGNWEDPQQTLNIEPWDVCGISAMTGQYEAATELAGRILKKGPILIGGVHITTCPESMRSEFHHAIKGEGEQALTHFLSTGQIKHFNPMSLTGYPDLNYRLLSPRYFQKRPIRTWQASVVESMLMTSRGCPYSCRFCSTTQFWKTYRAHDPAWVIRQMQHLAELGVTHIQIYDDLFTVAKPRLRLIAQQFRAAGLHRVIKGIGAMSRANVIDPEICDLLKSMNFKIVSFGFESGSERVLRYLKISGASVATNRNALMTVKRAGLRCVGSLMMGSPGETAFDMLKTIRFILWAWWNGAEDLWPFVTTPYPGTEFWRIAIERGKVSNRMDFRRLTIRSKIVGAALLCDVPRPLFTLIWYIGQVSLLPFKASKAAKLLWAWIKT